MKTPTTTIKNFLSIPVYNKNTKKYTYQSSLQASALVLSVSRILQQNQTMDHL